MNHLTCPYTKELKKIQKLKLFYAHAAVFLSINAILLIINLAINPGYLWFWWPLLFWTKGFVLHAISTFDKSPILPAENIHTTFYENNSNAY